MATDDKSKGKKKNHDLTNRKTTARAAELVITLAVEGGGFDIYRTPVPSGGRHFSENGSSMFMDEGIDECWIPWTSKPVATIQEALPTEGDGDSWIMFCPIAIHPDYRCDIWQMVQEVVYKLPDGRKRWWAERRQKRWERLLRRKVKLEPSPEPAKVAKPARRPRPVKKPRKTKPANDLFGNEIPDTE